MTIAIKRYSANTLKSFLDKWFSLNPLPKIQIEEIGEVVLKSVEFKIVMILEHENGITTVSVVIRNVNDQLAPYVSTPFTTYPSMNDCRILCESTIPTMANNLLNTLNDHHYI